MFNGIDVLFVDNYYTIELPCVPLKNDLSLSVYFNMLIPKLLCELELKYL